MKEIRAVFHEAARNGDLALVESLLESGQIQNADVVMNSAKFCALHFACASGHLDVVKSLIEKYGASTESTNSHGRGSPIINACANGHLHVVKYLVEEHNVSMSNHTCSPILLAAGNQHGEILRYLAGRPDITLNYRVEYDSPTALHSACYHDFPTVKMLLDLGACVHHGCGESTPLHAAADTTQPDSGEVAGYLLSHGADPLVRNIYGMTPLHQAKSQHVAKQLVQYNGGSMACQLLTIRDNENRTPAESCANEEVAAYLNTFTSQPLVVLPTNDDANDDAVHKDHSQADLARSSNFNLQVPFNPSLDEFQRLQAEKVCLMLTKIDGLQEVAISVVLQYLSTLDVLGPAGVEEKEGLSWWEVARRSSSTGDDDDPYMFEDEDDVLYDPMDYDIEAVGEEIDDVAIPDLVCPHCGMRENFALTAQN